MHIAPCTALSDAAAKEMRKAVGRFGAVDEDEKDDSADQVCDPGRDGGGTRFDRGPHVGAGDRQGGYSRRGNEFASDPIEVETQAWKSTHVATPEDTR